VAEATGQEYYTASGSGGGGGGSGTTVRAGAAV